MAGIGFELKKVILKGTLTQSLQAVISSVFIVAGPWLFTILTFFVLGRYLSFALTEAPGLFQAAIVYCYAISLVLFSPVQYFFTRLSADLIWQEMRGEASWFFLRFTLAVVFVASAIGLALAFLLPLPPLGHQLSFRIALGMLFGFLNGVWITMLFVSILKWYIRILMVYAAGMALILLWILLWGQAGGIATSLWGVALGHLFILAGLLILCLLAYPPRPVKSPGKILKETFKKNRLLILCGFLFFAGQWADKFLFWFDRGLAVEGSGLKLFDFYDIPVYWANLCIIPGLVYFVVFCETSFANSVAVFLQSLQHQPYPEIQKRKFAMIRTLKLELFRQSLFQLVFSSGAVLGLSLWMPSLFPVVFVTQYGVFFQLLLMTLLTFFFYLELYAEACMIAGLFFGIGLVGGAVSIAFPILPGVGYLLAGFTASALGLVLLLGSLKTIDRKIYMRIS